MLTRLSTADLTEGFYSVRELADLLRISTTTVYRKYEQGILPGTPVGGRVVFSKKAIAEWLTANSQQNQAVAPKGIRGRQ
jgi:excisionase family DNA binding protein